MRERREPEGKQPCCPHAHRVAIGFEFNGRNTLNGRGSMDFGVGAPPILVSLSGDWDVHWGYGVLTHSQIGKFQRQCPPKGFPIEARALLPGT